MTHHTAADIQCLLSFIFKRFGAPGDAGELPDEVVAAVRRLEGVQPQQPAGWRGIETAPKDGEIVLLASISDKHVMVREGRWDVASGKWTWPWICDLTPELWMPLPPAPGAHPSQQEDDAAMLDWLESQINEHGEIHLHDGNHPWGHGLGLRPGNLVRTLRQAINTAMTAARGDAVQGGGKNG